MPGEIEEDDRAGRSLERHERLEGLEGLEREDDTRREENTQREETAQRTPDGLHVDTKQHHPAQCPTPPPADPFPTFPAFELTAATPVTPHAPKQQPTNGVSTTSAPITSAPITSAPITSAPITTAPITCASGSTSRLRSSLVQEPSSLSTSEATDDTNEPPPASRSPRTPPARAVDASPRARAPSSAKKTDGHGHERKTSGSSGGTASGNKTVIHKLSASQMQALTSSPDSLPIAIVPPSHKPNGAEYPMSASIAESSFRPSMAEQLQNATRYQATQAMAMGTTTGTAVTTPLAMATEKDKQFPTSLPASVSTSGPASVPTSVPASLPASHPASVPATAALEPSMSTPRTAADFKRPPPSSRTLSSPPINRRSASVGQPFTTPLSGRRNSFNPLPRPAALNLNLHGSAGSAGPAGSAGSVGPAGSVRPPPLMSRQSNTPKPPRQASTPPSPMLPAIPLPPMSLPTHLQLELAGQRPSPLYIHHSQVADMPYESSAVKFERLLNALLLPPYLEHILFFGTLACLDAWLYTFTILPMRFFIAVGVLVKWWAYVVWKETRWLTGFVWQGAWRVWQRGRRGRTMSRDRADSSQPVSETDRSQSRATADGFPDSNSGRRRLASDVGSSLPDQPRANGHGHGHGNFHPPKHPMPRPGFSRHRRTKSIPSNLTSFHKADLLQGAILICSTLALINLDASRMYHFIRAQSSMKLYVIYNILEVGDRLLSAIGQDILECLFSSETLSRNSSGRSKILLPFGMFVLSLIYNVIHTWCLFYQVITLNVAVNSYSNSLLTLLISNQFVEIKGSVFKKIEKENLFQLTCSDVVERFQLWIILLIIGLRNVVEVGGLSVPGSGFEFETGGAKAGPLHTNSVLPASFTVLPSWLLSGEVLSPFLVVIGIEMLVDWIKHAYINKFNNVKPTLYRKMLDVLCKDYYTNAFSTPSLTRRLGLPLLPLSCLFIRASMQVYHMFLATHLHPPIPIPTGTTELSVESSTPSSPAMVAALEHLDTLIRNALGRAVYGYPQGSSNARPFWTFTSDDAIALLTMVVFFFLAWVVLLIVKLLLGMLLLRYSRKRYAIMKLKEHAVATGKAAPENFSQPGQRIGAFSAVEIGDDRRKWLYEDDPDGLRKMRDRERKVQEKFKEPGDDGLAKVVRYEMVAKRIW
ncbi:eukaryotic membrane protein family-domain-containing protein [Xylariomycetidae sp. FL0641]|nr:eukaryotic membrane protein family-domain-containing protein [Xylariomycetidae sp. FL0641]